MNKKTLRQQMRQRREAVDPVEKKRLDDAIASRLKRAINWQLVRSIHIYRSQSVMNEIDTSWLEAFLFEMWPNVTVAVGDISRIAAIPTGAYDVVIVPLLSFDDRRHRIGYGGGWYDRFLADQLNAVKIGLAYEFQRVSQIAAEPHDVPLDRVITESATYE